MTTSRLTTSGIFGSYHLKPGKKLPADFLTRLKEINAKRKKTNDFNAYKRDLRNLLQLSEVQITDNKIRTYVGFIWGEGSISISIKKTATGVYLDPYFNVTQHVNGAIYLYTLLEIFGTGSISYKAKSNATLVFSIDNRDSLKEKVIPFFEKHVLSEACENLKYRFSLFKRSLELFDEGAHLDLERLTKEVLVIWDKLRVQKGQSNQTFQDLKEAENYVRSVWSPSGELKKPRKRRQTPG